MRHSTILRLQAKQLVFQQHHVSRVQFSDQFDRLFLYEMNAALYLFFVLLMA